MTRMAFAIFAAVAIVGPVRAADLVNIPFKVVQAAFKTAECTRELQDEPRENVQELGGRLKLVEVYCWSAAYQAGSIFFAVNPAQPEKARLLRFQWWGNKRLMPVYSLTSPDFDPKTRKLGSTHKGRGVGDCGSAGEWKWTGMNFTLMRFWHKDACDGQPFDDDKKWLVYSRK